MLRFMPVGNEVKEILELHAHLQMQHLPKQWIVWWRFLNISNAFTPLQISQFLKYAYMGS